MYRHSLEHGLVILLSGVPVCPCDALRTVKWPAYLPTRCPPQTSLKLLKVLNFGLAIGRLFFPPLVSRGIPVTPFTLHSALRSLSGIGPKQHFPRGTRYPGRCVQKRVCPVDKRRSAQLVYKTRPRFIPKGNGMGGMGNTQNLDGRHG